MKKALIAIMLTAGAAHAADDDLMGFMLNAKGELCDEILDVEYMGKDTYLIKCGRTSYDDSTATYELWFSDNRTQYHVRTVMVVK